MRISSMILSRYLNELWPIGPLGPLASMLVGLFQVTLGELKRSCHLANMDFSLQIFPLILMEVKKILYFVWSPPWHVRTCQDVYLDISLIYSDSLSVIYSGILSGILSDILSDILSRILSGILSLRFDLAFNLTFYPAFFLTIFLTKKVQRCPRRFFRRKKPGKAHSDFWPQKVRRGPQRFSSRKSPARRKKKGRKEDIMTSKNLTTLTWQVGNKAGTEADKLGW